jgi:hypothetical protein
MQVSWLGSSECSNTRSGRLVLTHPTLSAALRIVKDCIRHAFIDLRTAAHFGINSNDRNDVMTPKNAAAVELGRKGGKATARKLTPQQRKESARRAAQARWARAKKEDQ